MKKAPECLCIAIVSSVFFFCCYKEQETATSDGIAVRDADIVEKPDLFSLEVVEESPRDASQEPFSFLFGLNIYHTSPKYWSDEAIPDVLEQVAICKGHDTIKAVRFFLPTLGDAPFLWQTEWLETTYKFISQALVSGRFDQIHIVVGYGLQYHLSEDIASLLPDSPNAYIKAVASSVEEQVRHVSHFSNPYGTRICWQIENELDISHRHEARPNREGFPWSDRSFVHELEKDLENAVIRGTNHDDPCIYVTLTPLSVTSQDIYPWEDNDWKERLDFVGLHYYPFGIVEVLPYLRDLIERSIKDVITGHGLPVMITEFGMRAATDESGVVVSGAEESRLWLREMVDLVRRLAASKEPVLGLFYFKWDDADAESEEACGYQGFMGFLKLGGQWFGHQEKIYPPELGGCPGPLACWCEYIAGGNEQ